MQDVEEQEGVGDGDRSAKIAELQATLIELQRDTDELMETYLKLFDLEPPDWSLLARWHVRAFSAMRAAAKSRANIEASIARISRQAKEDV